MANQTKPEKKTTKIEPLRIIQEEPICAISTPLGEGGISIIRLSGAGVFEKIAKVFKAHREKTQIERVPSHRILYGGVFSFQGRKIDEVLLLIMRAPHSYTREDVIEIHCHGGIMAGQRILQLLNSIGIRLAEAGEFTKRAFLNGRIDLAQAEAVMELIRSKSDLGYEAVLNQLDGGLSFRVNQVRDLLINILARIEVSIDFCEEDIDFIDIKTLQVEVGKAIQQIKGIMNASEDGILLREGLKTVITGRTNVGKSSLFNTLLRMERAIVTPHPGTTRDLLEETAMVGGVLLRIIDTAGFRQSSDPVEQEGITRSVSAKQSADLILLVLDGSEPLCDVDLELIQKTSERKRIIIINKTDKKKVWNPKSLWSGPIIEISATSGVGMEMLHQEVRRVVFGGVSQRDQSPLVTTLRQRGAFQKAHDSLNHLLRSSEKQMSWEFLAVDLRGALDALGEVTGVTVSENILDRIFKGFCIGK
ncbi:MAG TPA: tRNA uridine-5-carboxymethylaminomethyl(34) synthesis GTPase MnmE [Nitrospiria bacterium]